MDGRARWPWLHINVSASVNHQWMGNWLSVRSALSTSLAAQSVEPDRQLTGGRPGYNSTSRRLFTWRLMSLASLTLHYISHIRGFFEAFRLEWSFILYPPLGQRITARRFGSARRGLFPRVSEINVARNCKQVETSLEFAEALRSLPMRIGSRSASIIIIIIIIIIIN